MHLYDTLVDTRGIAGRSTVRTFHGGGREGGRRTYTSFHRGEKFANVGSRARNPRLRVGRDMTRADRIARSRARLRRSRRRRMGETRYVRSVDASVQREYDVPRAQRQRLGGERK